MAIEAKIVGVWPAPVRPPTVGPKPRVNNWPAGLQPVQHPPVDPATAYRTAAWIDPDAPKTGIWTPPGQRPDPPAGGGAGGRVEGDDKRLALAEEEKGFFDDFKPFGEDGFTFFDFLDIINPLQHVPIVGNIYRNLTGDTIDPASRLAGSTLFWGPIGTAVAAVNVALSYATGKDLAEHAFSIFVDPTDGGDGPATAEATIGSASPQPEDQSGANAPEKLPEARTPAVPPVAGFVPQGLPIETLPPEIIEALQLGEPVRHAGPLAKRPSPASPGRVPGSGVRASGASRYPAG